MTNNNNEMKIAETTTNKMEFEPVYKFYSILDYDSALDVTVNHLKSAIINLIIANTAESENISDIQLQYMTEYLNMMLKSGTNIKILSDNDIIEDIIIDDNYFNRTSIYQLSKLLNFVIQTRCWIQCYHHRRRSNNFRNKGFDFCCKETGKKYLVRFEISES